MAAARAGGIMQLVRNPVGLLTTGAAGAVGLYGAIAIPNAFLPIGVPAVGEPDTMMNKLMRAGVRAAAGGLLYTIAQRAMPASAGAVLTGATIAVGGGLILDFLNTRIILGAGDVVQTPQTMMAALGSGFSFSGYGAYTRPMGRFGAYTRPMGAYTPSGMIRTANFSGAGGPGIYGRSGDVY
jgi:hypothetical protein